MKRLLTYAAVALMFVAPGVTQAQKRVVDDVKRIISSKSANVQNFRDAQDKISVALSDDATENDPETWLVAGKVQFGLYQRLMAQSFNPSAEITYVKEMGKSLIDGYDFMKRALQLDSIKSGKPASVQKPGSQAIKTKHSDDIMKILKGHTDYYKTTGMSAFVAKDYKAAYRLFDIYCEIASATASAKEIAEALYYQSFAAQQIGNAQYPSFSNLILQRIEAKDLAVAHALVDRALDDQPNNANLLITKGYVEEMENNEDEAFMSFKKAAEIDPSNADANLNAGRVLMLKVNKIADQKPDKSPSELSPLIKPTLEKALIYLTKAKELNSQYASNYINNINNMLKMMSK